MKESPIRIAIVDDDKLLRQSIVSFIESFGGFTVIMQADNGRELLQKLPVASTLPHICIVDINMPVMNGYETVERLKATWPNIKILVLTAFKNEYSVIKMLQKGVNGYLTKNSDPSELKKALTEIYYNDYYQSSIDTERLFHLLFVDEQHAAPELSPEELNFLALCCTELTYKEMAERMKVSIRKIEVYRSTLFERLNVKSRVGLVMYAIRIGIVPIGG